MILIELIGPFHCEDLIANYIIGSVSWLKSVFPGVISREISFSKQQSMGHWH